MCIPYSFYKNPDGGSVIYEITAFGFHFEPVSLSCQWFLLLLLYIHEVWGVCVNASIAQFESK